MDQLSVKSCSVKVRFSLHYSSLFGQERCKCGHFTQPKKDLQELKVGLYFKFGTFFIHFFFLKKYEIFKKVYPMVLYSLTPPQKKKLQFKFSEENKYILILYETGKP